jgi:hypothetical protein
VFDRRSCPTGGCKDRRMAQTVFETGPGTVPQTVDLLASCVRSNAFRAAPWHISVNCKTTFLTGRLISSRPRRCLQREANLTTPHRCSVLGVLSLASSAGERSTSARRGQISRCAACSRPSHCIREEDLAIGQSGLSTDQRTFQEVGDNTVQAPPTQ